ncbi:hypothetical protein EDB80DRAFT_673993 [Ilyonectria destructans]|nr:hypothetical protein EDB80DRAFT_673993 [Ilyonectria destructans]
MNIAGPRPVATGWTLIAIAAGVIIARLYLRLKIQRRRLLASDMFMCDAWVEKNWDMDPNSTCPPVRGSNVFRVGWTMHLVGDLLVFTLPWLVVTGLNLRMTLKIGVYCTFLLGLINIVFDVLRFVPIQAAQVGDSASISLITLWGILDVNIGIVIACLPALRPYFNKSESSQGDSSNSEAKSWGSSVPPGAVRTVRPVGSNPQHNTNGPEDNWDDKRKSNGSEVELFQRNSRVVEIA